MAFQSTDILWNINAVYIKKLPDFGYLTTNISRESLVSSPNSFQANLAPVV